jgi:cobalt-zinc-cadmium resistance protein CzcA
VAAVAAGGWLAFTKLPIDAFPEVSPVQVKIVFKAPGMTPEEVETRISVPIEVEMLGIPHQESLRSTNKYGIADITLKFADGTDIYWARQQVAERLNNIMGDLPAGMTGGITPITTPLGEIFMFTIESDTLSLIEKRDLLDWVIRPALRTVPGVADVNALGGEARALEVVPDLLKMAANEVTLEALRQVIAANNSNDGAGRLDEGGESLLVREEGRIRTPDDLRAIVVAMRDGAVVRLGDVAEVRTGALTRYGAVTRNGQGEAVEGLVLSLAGANARDVVAGVKARLAELQPGLPAGTRLHVFYDRAHLVDKAVGTVSKALLEATALVLVLLGLFLGNARAAITVAVILPLSALVTFILMHQFGMSANLMSLGGLAIAIGMLVDAAVVVVENVVQHLAHDPSKGRLPLLHLVNRAVREVATPVTAGILIIITVFLPLLTLQGLEGKLFVPVALTIIFALAGSLLLSLTVIPVLASFLLRGNDHADPWLPRQMLRLYTPLLAASLRRPAPVIIGALVLLAGAGVIYTQVGKTFMPTMDEGNILIGIEKQPTVSLSQTLELDSRVQQALMKSVPEITGIVARAGSDEIGLDPMGINQTDTFLELKPADEWRTPNDKDVLLDRLREVMEGFPGLVYSFSQPIEMRVSEMIIGVRGDLALKVFGPDLKTLNALAEQMEQVLKKVPGSQDVYTVQNGGVQYLRLQVDRLAAGRFGLNVSDVQDALRLQVEGEKAGMVVDGNRRVPILVRGPADIRMSPEAFANLNVLAPDGRSVPLAAIADLTREEGPVKVEREAGSRYSVVIANVSGRDLVGFVDEAKAKMARGQTAAGLSPGLGRPVREPATGGATTGIVIPVALGLIFLLLFSTFGSVRQALLVLSNIPFALVGGIVALWVSGEYLSVPASVGFIALLGIAVLNGVVLVSYFNQLHAEGLSLAGLRMVGSQRRACGR